MLCFAATAAHLLYGLTHHVFRDGELQTLALRSGSLSSFYLSIIWNLESVYSPLTSLVHKTTAHLMLFCFYFVGHFL